MKLSEFDYNLPRELIAQKPVTPRDSSRLFVIDRERGQFEHRVFNELGDFLQEGDVVVLNNSRVIPARLIGEKKTGGKIEIFLLREVESDVWEALLNRKVSVGDVISVGGGFRARIKELPGESNKWLVEFEYQDENFEQLLEKYGQTPLPPYISQDDSRQTREQYQTIYASSDKKGSVAAPTAGLHFTEGLMDELSDAGVQFEYITLHVGLGTFAPVRSEKIEKHKMHAEYVEVEEDVIARLQEAKKEGRRIIAVGTTSVRTLESIASLIADSSSTTKSFSDWVNSFIYPGYEFGVIDGMITNFHLPKSTLLMLVSALAGQDLIKKAYQEAIDKRYRFYSFGDAMFIL